MLIYDKRLGGHNDLRAVLSSVLYSVVSATAPETQEADYLIFLIIAGNLVISMCTLIDYCFFKQFRNRRTFFWETFDHVYDCVPVSKCCFTGYGGITVS